MAENLMVRRHRGALVKIAGWATSRSARRVLAFVRLVIITVFKTINQQ